MALALALAYAAVCAGLLWRMAAGRTALDAQLGVMAAFAFGYFPLPVLLKPYSDLAGIADDKIFWALLIHALFLASVLAGVALARRPLASLRPLAFAGLDGFALRHRVALSCCGFAAFVAYALYVPQTSYAAEDFEAFFAEKSPLRSLLAALSGFALAFVAMAFAAAALWRRRGQQGLFGGMILAAVLLSLPLGQRLATLTPLALLTAALGATGQTRRAASLIAVIGLVLLVLSPFAVYMRESRRASGGDLVAAADVTAGYSLSADPLARGLSSLLERSDLVFNTISMKDHFDAAGPVGWPYYYSALVSPVPRFVYPNKPYALSDDGRLEGEISVLAWRTMIGGLGSLTAFGGLTAYREGGWVGVLLDGLAAGAFFAFVARWLGEGSFVARVFYANFFVLFAVQKAPPAFLEALTSFLSQSPLLLCVLLAARAPLWLRDARRAAPARPAWRPR